MEEIWAQPEDSMQALEREPESQGGVGAEWMLEDKILL